MTAPDDPFRLVRVRAVLAVIALVTLGMLLSYRPVAYLLGDPYAESLVEAAIYVTVCGMLAWLCRRVGVDLRRLFGPVPSPAAALGTAALALPLMALSAGGFWLLYLPLSWLAPGFVESVALAKDPILVKGDAGHPLLPNLLVFACLCLLAPFAEEFVFRGLVLHRWGTRWKVGRAVVLSSLFFGLLHIEPIGGTIFGMVAAILYLETRSLLQPVVLHVSNNGIAWLWTMAEIGVTGAEVEYDLASFRGDWWMGAVGLAVGLPWAWRFFRRHWRPASWTLPHTARGGVA